MTSSKRHIGDEIIQGLKEAQAWKIGKLKLRRHTAALATRKDDEATIKAARKRLKGSLVKYDRPCDPVIDPDS
jgi:hypothetical protein